MPTIDEVALEKAIDFTKKRFRYSDTNHEVVNDLINIFSLRKARLITQNTQEKISSAFEHSEKIKKEIDLSDISKENADPLDLINDKLDLPSLPNIFSQIIELLSNPLSSSKNFADVIAQDPALSAKLLKLVNSAFYGRASKIDTISRAITIIGTKELYGLSLSMSVLTMFDDIPQSLVDMPSFWQHSLGCGVIARALANHLKQGNSERFFVAGLLHDIGRLVLYKHLPFQTGRALNKATQLEMLLYESEQEILGYDHTRIGGLLSKRWKLPDRLVNMIRYHHSPKKAVDLIEAGIVHLADIITNALEIGSSGEHMVPPLDDAVWESLNFPTTTLARIIETAEQHIYDMIRVLLPESSLKVH